MTSSSSPSLSGKFRFGVLLLGLLLLCLPVRAAEDAGRDAEKKADAQEDPAADAAEKERQDRIRHQAEASIKVFRKEFKSRKLPARMQAILSLAKVKHDLVIEELAEKPLNDRDPEVRDAVAQMLGEMTFNPELAGAALKEALAKNSDYPDVQRSIIRSIGNLGYMGALEELKAAAEHLNEEAYRWVTVEVVRTFGKLNDARALPFLLWMAEYGGKVLKWSTGEVKVDTTTAGDADQRAAEAEWHRRYGHVKPKKPPAPLIRTYMQELRNTVKKITGQEFEDATQFRKWLGENAKKFGLDPKQLDKD